MRRTEVYKTTQFWLTIIGSWLIVASWVATSSEQTMNTPDTSGRPSRLQVVPVTRTGGSSGTSLQGAGSSLQRQAAASLQQPSTSDLLQPNAKTDSFNTDSVQ